MRVMAFYGKGGIGKSTTVSNLSVLFARTGKRVLQFGCDPKADSSYSLVPGWITTVMDEWMDRGESGLKLEHCLLEGRHQVHCIEVGGPTPGSGCGGRGITKAFELVGDPEVLRRSYDVILFDVLGDVVCGGFSAPMRAGYADEVYVVTSGEIRSLYAANNICHAVVRNAPNGVKLGGLIGNLRGIAGETERLEKFAGLIGSNVVHSIPRDPAVAEAESRRVPVIEFDESCPATAAFKLLFERIAGLKPGELHQPRPLLRADFDRLLADARS
jgi:nitrogenase iron protein NifH